MKLNIGKVGIMDVLDDGIVLLKKEVLRYVARQVTDGYVYFEMFA